MKIVPFKRLIRLGDKGFDVLAIKRALKNAGDGKGIVLVPSFGKAMQRDLRHFQKSHGLVPDGVYGPRTHARLEPFFTAYARWLYARQSPPKPTNSKRVAVTKYAHWGVANRSRFTYAEIRPIPSAPYAPHITTDCSGFATLAYKAAGAADPNGNHYNGSGYTGTLQSHGTRVTAPHPGDLVFYKSPDHVAIYVGNGKVVSHGGAGDPVEVAEWYRTVWDIRSYLG